MLEIIKELRERTGAGMLDCKKALKEADNDIEKAILILREKGAVKAEKKQSRIAAEGLALVNIKDNKGVILEVNSETDFVAKNDKFVNLCEIISEAILENNPKDVEEALKLKIDDESIEEKIIHLTATIGEKLSFRRFELLEKNDGEILSSYIHGDGKIAVLVYLEGGNDELALDIAMQVAAMNPQFLTSAEVDEGLIKIESDLARKEAIEANKPEKIIDKLVEGRLNKYFKEICLVDQIFIKDSKKQVKDLLQENNAKIKGFVRFEVGEGLEKRCEDFQAEVMSQIK